MTFGLVDGQAVKLIFFAPCDLIPEGAVGCSSHIELEQNNVFPMSQTRS